MHLKLNVTGRDIAKGEKANPANCAIARALMRNKAICPSRVSVFYDKCLIQATNKVGRTVNYIARLPDEASTFVHRFDNFKAVAPLKFALNLTRTSKAENIFSAIK